MEILYHNQLFDTKLAAYGGNGGKTTAPYYASIIPLA